jgi:thiol:disulfide interchange protein DsbD
MKKRLLACWCLWGIGLAVFAQMQPRVAVQAIRTSDSTARLSIKAQLPDSLLLFSVKKRGADDPFTSMLQLDTSRGQRLLATDTVIEKGTVQLLPDGSGGTYRLFADSVEFIYNVHTSGQDSLSGSFVWLGKLGNEFPNGEEKWELTLPAKHAADMADSGTAKSANSSSWSLFLLALAAGFAAVFTPCVFPLIPVTVSFFLKRSKSRAEGIRNAWVYALSIILIYTAPTLLLTLIFGHSFLYNLSTHPVTNLLFFAIFIVFAISFFGAFELELPSSWADKTDSIASRGGLIGIFFMALTLVIVSFSCTGPIVGTLLGQTSSQGMGMGPVLGMLGFGIGLALPFGVFALFPDMLKSLPKSGGWLNTVKVFFGFLELALAMKFFSNADLAYHWGLLNREVFLAIWIVLFVLLGLYLLGKLKFSHDSDLPFISVPRLFLAIASFSLAAYMVPGMWGAPLTPLSGILPPPSTQKFNLDDLQYKIGRTTPAGNGSTAPAPKKYADKFHVPFGLTAYFDIEEGLAAARVLNKPVMIDFTGWSCANCRKMENEVWSHPDVLKKLQNEFVLVSLYVDDKTKLPAEEQYTNKAGERITTIGAKNLDYEISAFNLNAQPLYKFVDLQGRPLSDVQYGYDPDVSKFISHLNMVLAEFKKR